MVTQLASQLVTYPTAQVNVGDREDEEQNECNFHGRLLVEKWPCAWHKPASINNRRSSLY